tara:strand:- start:1850 stop:2038 length:189 start_codon:yes stop_codon:yes gene_type:complete
VLDKVVVANKQTENAVTGVYQMVFQLFNLKFGQVAVVAQVTLAVTVVHIQSAALEETMVLGL